MAFKIKKVFTKLLSLHVGIFASSHALCHYCHLLPLFFIQVIVPSFKMPLLSFFSFLIFFTQYPVNAHKLSLGTHENISAG
jgi:hypothetical protein